MDWMLFSFEILGTMAFAVSGAAEAMKKEMDLLGVLVLGLVTAVGGGILRDVLTGQLPPLSFQNPRNALIAIFTAFAAFLLAVLLSRREKKTGHLLWSQVLFFSDAVGLGTFTVLGIRCVQGRPGCEAPALLLFVGVVTGVGGGLLRDIFAGNVPYIFQKHVYATASIAGAVLYFYLEKTGYPNTAAVASLLLVLLLRLLAAHFRWNLPRVRINGTGEEVPNSNEKTTVCDDRKEK